MADLKCVLKTGLDRVAEVPGRVLGHHALDIRQRLSRIEPNMRRENEEGERKGADGAHDSQTGLRPIGWTAAGPS